MKLSSQFVLGAALLTPLLSAAQTISSFSPATGPTGTAITILGSGLGNAKSLLLNGQSLAINTATNTAFSLTVPVPVAASTGKLVVTAGSGAVVSATQFGVTRSTSGVTFPQQTAKGSSFNTIKVASVTDATVVGRYTAVNYSTPTVADLTGTGRTDLLVGNIEYWKQTTVGGPAFSKRTTTPNLQLSSGADIRVADFAKPTVADIDGNGLLDLLVGTGDNQRIARFEQTAAGAITFTSKGNIQLAAGGDLVTGAYFPRPAITDLDGNGKLDMLIGDYSGLLKHYEASTVGGTTFVADAGNMQADGANVKADGTAKPLVFDLDGNGLLDFVVGSQLGAITRYEQSARYSLTFTSKGNLTTDGSTAINMGTTGNAEGGYAAPIITDVDNDGRLDVFVGDANGTIYLYTQAQQAPLAASPLPVVLSAFAGQATSAGSLLSWATATELNSARFDIERSADGQGYTQVGSVAAAGASARSYYYLDAAAPASPSYYRLRQVDQDGTSAYSPVVVVSRAGSLAATAKPLAFPRPFTDALQVALPGAEVPQTATVALLTLDGRTVYSRAVQLGATPQALADLPVLAPGLYVLRTTTAAGATSQCIGRN